MTLIYLAGMLSGIVLIVLALAGWVSAAIHQMKGKTDDGKAPRHRDHTTDTGAASLALYRARRDSRRAGPTARAA